MKKRKRARKKGKAAKPKAEAAVSGGEGSADEDQTLINLITLSREDHNDDHDGDDDDDDDDQSPMEVNTPSSTGTDQPLHLASINPDGSIDKAAATAASGGGGVKGVGRVKVKLKSSKILESRTDTDRSSPVQNLGLEKQGEDSGNSVVPEIKMYVSRRPGGIKIKSSSSTKVLGGGGRGGGSSSGDVVVVEDEDEDEGLPNKELETPHKENRYDKKELDSALLVCWEFVFSCCFCLCVIVYPICRLLRR